MCATRPSGPSAAMVMAVAWAWASSTNLFGGKSFYFCPLVFLVSESQL